MIAIVVVVEIERIGAFTFGEEELFQLSLKLIAHGKVGADLFARKAYKVVPGADLLQVQRLQAAETYLPSIVPAHLIPEKIDISFPLPELDQLFIYQLNVEKIVVALAADQQAACNIHLVMKAVRKMVAFMNSVQLFQQVAPVLVACSQGADDGVGDRPVVSQHQHGGAQSKSRVAAPEQLVKKMRHRGMTVIEGH